MKTNPNMALMRKNFEFAIRPVYYFSRLTGQWPFSINHVANGTVQRVRVGFFDVLWLTLMICLNIILSFDSYESLIARREKHAIPIRTVMEYLWDMSSFLFVTIGFVLGVINRNKLVNILGKFNTFDYEVR